MKYPYPHHSSRIYSQGNSIKHQEVDESGAGVAILIGVATAASGLIAALVFHKLLNRKRT